MEQSLSYQARRALLQQTAPHYREASPSQKRTLLDAFVAATGYERFFEEVRAIRDGGGFGSIVGRNSFQRTKSDALKFLGTVMGIYEGSIQ